VFPDRVATFGDVLGELLRASAFELLHLIIREVLESEQLVIRPVAPRDASLCQHTTDHVAHDFGVVLQLAAVLVQERPRNVFAACSTTSVQQHTQHHGLVDVPMSFYVLRFLLGVAEAGFFPGVIYYLSLWYPGEQRARAA
jgi:hypothetical protein